ncbi:A-kinase anchor protein 14 [Microcaecilia unicolor]|uniref:A-kinase anchor protein 14 n=1 Tax=Microcaecilia unicolor TaxID=1415580 RepID=A0A6P7YLZ1_9AMPH|nr:A-kinase anchor protein 14 [Microcaecilia unicolor]
MLRHSGQRSVPSEDDCDTEAVEKIAANIVQLAITRSVHNIESSLKVQSYYIKNIEWMACEDFTVERGLQQLEEYVSTWEIHDSWLHCTDFLHEEDQKYCKRYHYRMKWSIPTRRKPIPRATASVYFIIQLSKIKPLTLPIEVLFILESNRMEHRPGKTRFREKWLKDIIESKILLMKNITF